MRPEVDLLDFPALASTRSGSDSASTPGPILDSPLMHTRRPRPCSHRKPSLLNRKGVHPRDARHATTLFHKTRYKQYGRFYPIEANLTGTPCVTGSERFAAVQACAAFSSNVLIHEVAKIGEKRPWPLAFGFTGRYDPQSRIIIKQPGLFRDGLQCKLLM